MAFPLPGTCDFYVHLKPQHIAFKELAEVQEGIIELSYHLKAQAPIQAYYAPLYLKPRMSIYKRLYTLPK